MIRFISLFAGIGGIDLGFERAGMKCVMQVEINPFARRVLDLRFPGVPKHDDVFTFDKGVYDGAADLICGGDPCQENSNARRNGDTLSPSLGDQFIRIVAERRPRLVLRENPSVVRKDAPWPWWRFRASLEGLGYAVLPFRLRACCTGADHRRERLFLLAELQDANGPRLEGNELPEVARADEGGHDADAARPTRGRPAPRICRGIDGIPDRPHRIKAVGNAVDAGVAELIGRAIVAGWGEK